ncbi:MAG: 3-methyl-2-oxobutanoate hydroxymethyltransferase [Castellaniella sp.]
MSVHGRQQRLGIPELMAGKAEGRKMVALTAYSAPIARLLDGVIDMILVGDSTAMVAYGLPDTLSFTIEQVAAHTAAVVRSTQRPCVIADMPFGSYQASVEQAFANAARLMAEGGASGVKLEGGVPLAATTRYLVERGIPVLAHVGLMPQYVNVMGGFRAQGMDAASAARILEDARAHQDAGAWAVVIEGVAEPLGREITEALHIPTIGIGASPACDGQILVTEDILGLSGDRIPRFAHAFADVGPTIASAVQAYADAVREGRFPTLEHCFGVRR